MKRILKFLIAIPLFSLVFHSTSVMAQPVASGHTGSHAESRPPAGGGSAPIGGGIFILLTMAVGYGIRKIFDARNSIVEEASSEQSDIPS